MRRRLVVLFHGGTEDVQGHLPLEYFYPWIDAGLLAEIWGGICGDLA